MKLKKFNLAYLFTFLNFLSFTQSFAPAPGNIGSTAFYKDSSVFTAWATGINFTRGFLDISDKSLGYASFGTEQNALGKAEGNSFNVVSFGDSGVAILTFALPIINGEGFDFAVFENGFADNYIEYAFVEVSTDGINYFRFPAISETPISPQMGNFEFSDCRFVHNLAGKYRQGFGTPFDLSELPDDPNLDKQNINFVKIIDVIGSVNPLYASRDSQGNIINDPWPSSFESGGFDLDGVGVIHEKSAGIDENLLDFKIFDNGEQLLISSSKPFQCEVYALDGKLILSNLDADFQQTIRKRSKQSFVILKILEGNKFYFRKILL